MAKAENRATGRLAPYSLMELQVRSPLGYEEFSRYDLFIKITLDDKDLSKRFGPAGDGYQYHHIVTQGGQNATKIPAAQLQNTAQYRTFANADTRSSHGRISGPGPRG